MNRLFQAWVLSMATLFATPSLASASDQGSTWEQQVAVVRLEVHHNDGRVTRSRVKAVPWGDELALELKSQGHKHGLRLNLADARGAAAMTYRRDGQVVIRRSMDSSARRKMVVFRDAKTRVVLSMVVTKVRVVTSEQ